MDERNGMRYDNQRGRKTHCVGAGGISTHDLPPKFGYLDVGWKPKPFNQILLTMFKEIFAPGRAAIDKNHLPAPVRRLEDISIYQILEVQSSQVKPTACRIEPHVFGVPRMSRQFGFGGGSQAYLVIEKPFGGLPPRSQSKALGALVRHGKCGNFVKPNLIRIEQTLEPRIKTLAIRALPSQREFGEIRFRANDSHVSEISFNHPGVFGGPQFLGANIRRVFAEPTEQLLFGRRISFTETDEVDILPLFAEYLLRCANQLRHLLSPVGRSDLYSLMLQINREAIRLTAYAVEEHGTGVTDNLMRTSLQEYITNALLRPQERH
jgi:hypothetical protein